MCTSLSLSVPSSQWPPSTVTTPPCPCITARKLICSIPECHTLLFLFRRSRLFCVIILIRMLRFFSRCFRVSLINERNNELYCCVRRWFRCVVAAFFIHSFGWNTINCFFFIVVAVESRSFIRSDFFFHTLSDLLVCLCNKPNQQREKQFWLMAFANITDEKLMCFPSFAKWWIII